MSIKWAIKGQVKNALVAACNKPINQAPLINKATVIAYKPTKMVKYNSIPSISIAV